MNYMDRTFCSAEGCTNKKCYRYLHDFDRHLAGQEGLPISLIDFSLATVSEDGEVNEGCLEWTDE